MDALGLGREDAWDSSRVCYCLVSYFGNFAEGRRRLSAVEDG